MKSVIRSTKYSINKIICKTVQFQEKSLVNYAIRFPLNARSNFAFINFMTVKRTIKRRSLANFANRYRLKTNTIRLMSKINAQNFKVPSRIRKMKIGG